MRIRVAWAATLLILGSTEARAAEPFQTWTVKGDFGKLKYTLLCALKPGGGHLAGPCVTAADRVMKASGTLDAEKFHLGYQTDYNNNGLHLDYRGRRGADGVIRGAVDTGISKGVFEAQLVSLGSADGPEAWRLDVGFSDSLKYVVICFLALDGRRLAGPCAVAQGPVLQAEGDAGGGGFALSYDTQYEGRAVHVSYAGAAQRDGAVHGQVRAGDSLGRFEAAGP